MKTVTPIIMIKQKTLPLLQQNHLNDLELVASILAESHILVTGLSVSGDTLEDYFLSKIGGMKDVKSPKN